MNRVKYAVYLFDGTGQDHRNDDEKRDWSNIVRLHAFLHQSPPSDGELLDMYGEGVGCRGNENVFNEASGQGLEERIEEAYYDIGCQVRSCRDAGDDLHVSVFGFSRGAYAARVFCALVGYCGVPFAVMGKFPYLCSTFIIHPSRYEETTDNTHGGLCCHRFCPVATGNQPDGRLAVLT